MSSQPGATASAPLLLFSDQPLSREVDDTLDRGPFTGAAARVLDGLLDREPSTVAALVGPWGSGKTSTVNFVLGKLPRPDGVVRLDPWMVGGPLAVAQEVVTAVTRALRLAGLPSAEVRAVSRYLKVALAATATSGWAFGGALAAQHGVDLGPEAAAVVGEVARALVTSSAERKKVKDAAEATLEEAFAATSRLLRARGKGVLVVIDDVDRLQPEELLSLFRSVRLLGRLPYVHYLLAYDEKTVLGLLASPSGALTAPGRALEYLEKMVPMRLEQPEVTTDHLHELLSAGWDDLLHDLAVPVSTWTTTAWGAESEALLSRVLVTPRAVHRFFAQLRLTLDLVGPHDVDVVDLAVLTVLRLHLPDLYRSLSAQRALLTGHPSADADESVWGQRLEALLKTPTDVDDRVWASAVEAVHRLFPVTSPADDAAVQWLQREQPGRRGQRAQDPDYVGRYFALSPLAGDLGGVHVTEAVRAVALGEASDAADRLRRALSPGTDRRAVAGLQRLLRKVHDVVVTSPLAPEGAAALVATVCAAAPLPRKAGLDPEAPAVNLLGTLLGQVAASGLPPWRELVARVSRSEGAPASPLWLLVRASRAGAPAAADASLAGLTPHLEDAAWAAVLANLKDGDDAPIDEVGDLGAWVFASSRSSGKSDRVAKALDAGVNVLGLVARLLPLGHSRQADGSTRTFVFMELGDAVALLEAVGADRVRSTWTTSELEQLATQRAGPEADPLDTLAAAPTWAHRRAAAASALLTGLLGAGAAPPSGELEPSGLAAPIASEGSATTSLAGFDIRLVLTVVVPAIDQLLITPVAAYGLLGPAGWSDPWEAEVQRLLTATPTTAWWAGAHGGPGTAPRWRVAADRGQRISFAEGPELPSGGQADLDPPAGGTPEVRAVFAQALLGSAPGLPQPRVAITLTLSVGLRLRRLPAPEDSRSGWRSRPAEPARLEEVASGLLALLRSAPIAAAALHAVPEVGSTGSVDGGGGQAAVHLLLECSGDIADRVVVPLTGRLQSGRTTQFRTPATTADLNGLDVAGAAGASARHVRRALTDWLGEAGWRAGVDELVTAAVEAAASRDDVHDGHGM